MGASLERAGMASSRLTWRTFRLSMIALALACAHAVQAVQPGRPNSSRSKSVASVGSVGPVRGSGARQSTPTSRVTTYTSRSGASGSPGVATFTNSQARGGSLVVPNAASIQVAKAREAMMFKESVRISTPRSSLQKPAAAPPAPAAPPNPIVAEALRPTPQVAAPRRNAFAMSSAARATPLIASVKAVR